MSDVTMAPPSAPTDAVAQIDLDAYCARIGHNGPRVPTLETLRALQEQHLAAITFEAVDVLLGRGVDLSATAVDAKLIGAHRGGYCFEQNSLFMRALSTMGYAVEGLAARVRWMRPAHLPMAPRTHMALRVTVDGEPWLVDVGFGGCVPTAPLRLSSEAPQPTSHERFRLRPEGGSLVLEAERSGEWLAVYELLPEPQVAFDYEVANWFTSTHPNSPFRRNLIVTRVTPEARYALLDNRFTVRKASGETEQHQLDAAELDKVLVEIFALPVAPDWRPVIERAVAASAG